MSNDIVERTGLLAQSTAVDAAWGQWSSLTSLAVPANGKRARSIVDPEGLVLASLALGSVERRLEDLVAAWARDAAFLMSKLRFRSVGAFFPKDVKRRLTHFARHAVDGGDGRWKSWITSDDSEFRSRHKPLGPLRLTEGPALVLRLRAGFGVTAKADILAMLLGLEGTPGSLKAITAATGYSERMIRTAANEMVLAGLIVEVPGRPSSFYVEPRRWAQLLLPDDRHASGDEPSLPPWRFWAAILAFLCDVRHWAHEAKRAKWSEYVAASRARDLYDGHLKRLHQAGIRPPAHVSDSLTRTNGLGVLYQVVDQIRSWSVESR